MVEHGRHSMLSTGSGGTLFITCHLASLDREGSGDTD